MGEKTTYKRVRTLAWAKLNKYQNAVIYEYNVPLLCETRSTVYQTARVGVDFLCNFCSKYFAL